jgi:hypothetical protein
MVAHFLKKQEYTKVHFTLLILKKNLVPWFNGNKVDVSKVIKSILIGAHLHIPNIYTSRKKLKFEKKKKNYVKGPTMLIGATKCITTTEFEISFLSYRNIGV